MRSPYIKSKKAFSLFLNYSQQLDFQNSLLLAENLIHILQTTLKKSRNLIILEPGIGYGRIAIPLAIKGAPFNFQIYGFDNSPYMLEELTKRINNLPVQLRAQISGRLFFRQLAAESEWPYPEKFFDVVILSYILHYLKDWQIFLDKCDSHSKGCIVFLKEISPFNYWLNGDFSLIPSNAPHQVLYEFWHYFYKLKESYAEKGENQEITPIAYQPAIHYLAFQKGYHVSTYQVDLPLTRRLKFSELLSWIRYGAFVPLRESINRQARTLLAHRMKEWLLQRGISPKETLVMKGGTYEICICHKT